jgi:hypothetical protein
MMMHAAGVRDRLVRELARADAPVQTLTMQLGETQVPLSVSATDDFEATAKAFCAQNEPAVLGANLSVAGCATSVHASLAGHFRVASA